MIAVRVVSILLIGCLILVAGVALAEPAGEARYVPVQVGAGIPPSSVVVVPGDNLWKLSARRLEETGGEPPTPPEVAPYWRAVIEANHGRLRSGDPNLIYPGEVVVLPPEQG